MGHTQTFTFVIPRKTEANEAKVKPVRIFPVVEVLRLLRVATSPAKSYVVTVKLYTKNQNYNIQN